MRSVASVRPGWCAPHTFSHQYSCPAATRQSVLNRNRSEFMQHDTSGAAARKLAGTKAALGHKQQQAECKQVQKLQRHPVPLLRLQAAVPSAVPNSRNTLTILQWNLLADGLAQHGDFIKVHPEVLQWQYRKPLILQEVAEANADVLCFQELNHYDEILQALSEYGYTGAFMPKGRSPACKYSSPADGVALFWRTTRLEAISPPTGFYYLDEAGEESAQCCLHVLLREVLPANEQQQQQARESNDAVGQNGHISPLAGQSWQADKAPRQLQVATTHLKAKEGAVLDQVRISQMRQLLQGLTTSLETAGSSAPGVACSVSSVDGSLGRASLPLQCTAVVIAGDFNSVPQSGLCKLLSAHPWSFQSIWDAPVDTSALGVDWPLAASGDKTAGTEKHADKTRIASELSSTTADHCAPGVRAASPARQAAAEMVVSEQRSSRSCSPACTTIDALSTLAASMSSSDEHPGEFSTWKFRSGGESKRIIDHIYFSQGAGLVPLRRWRMLSEAEIGETGLPCAGYPSDHIALCCEFEWI